MSTRASDELAEVRVLTKPGPSQGIAVLIGTTVDAMLIRMANTTLLKWLPTLDSAANFAAFVASEQAGAITGAIVNLTGGSIVD